MFKEFQLRTSVLLLGFLTIAAVAFAFINFQKESSFEQPTDGVWWVESTGGLAAQRVLPDGPAQRAGIKPGDLLTSINAVATPQVASLVRVMYATGTFRRATYSLMRSGVPIDVQVILVPSDHGANQGARLIALIYLGIGIYVLFRRWTAPKSTHFFVFCLVSFVLYSFKFTGKLNEFDWIIYWGNVAAWALQPALFLHFAATFPSEQRELRKHRLLIALLYLPGLLLVGLHIIAIQLWAATELLKHRLDQLDLGYLALYYVLAALVLFLDYQREQSPLRRQQLKWLTRGTLLAVAPFTLLYVIPFLADWNFPIFITRVAGLFLVFLPLTFSYAIVRYRLMDVDLIFKRGVSYTLATGLLIGFYFAIVAIAAETVHTKLPNFGAWGLILTIIITAQVFDPLKRTIQERIDRLFDRKRYDYRDTLTEFGRGLSSETDLKLLLHSIVERLAHALLVSRVAIFLAEDSGNLFSLAETHGWQAPHDAATLDTTFLDFQRDEQRTHTFFETTQNPVHLTEGQQRAVRALDLNYYIPCRLKHRTVAIIGLGRTTGGDFLSSEDIELLESLASYIGIAIQNARLYASLEEKADEYEQLKEFNENIVESINIGILAVDLEDRIESWNAQMEVMYATPRADALGKQLAKLFPPDFIEEFNRVRDDAGVHNLYKFRLATPAGELRTANIAVAPLVNRNFRTLGRIILVDDITSRMQLESQLSQAEKLSSIGLLAAGVAHEVNTPLAVISSYTQMLAKRLRDHNEVAPLLDKITQQTFRASEIVNGLLNFSRTGMAEYRDINLNDIIKETILLIDHQFRKAQIGIEQDLDPELPLIRGNQGKLQQVFLNLMLNAKDAMEAGGTLRIHTEANGHVAVRISDTGEGIAREHLERIYDPFFTTKNAPREGQRRGTGLGLSVSYGIIQEHAGKIQVESEVGRGTTFQIEFPLMRKSVHA